MGTAVYIRSDDSNVPSIDKRSQMSDYTDEGYSASESHPNSQLILTKRPEEYTLMMIYNLLSIIANIQCIRLTKDNKILIELQETHAEQSISNCFALEKATNGTLLKFMVPKVAFQAKLSDAEK